MVRDACARERAAAAYRAAGRASAGAYDTRLKAHTKNAARTETCSNFFLLKMIDSAEAAV